MNKRELKFFFIQLVSVLGFVSHVHALTSEPRTATIYATPAAAMIFEVASQKLNIHGNQLTISYAVDHASPQVSSGVGADQVFKDQATGETYFGYYLSTGVRSVSQASSNIQIKLRHGSEETNGRTYYHLGNQDFVPSQKNDLVRAPSGYTTFVRVPSNTVRCGSNYQINGLKEKIHCEGNATSRDLDLTQFVKISNADQSGTMIVSQLELIAAAE